MDEVALVAQLVAGGDGAFDVTNDYLVGAVGVVVLLHQHQDVVDVDVDLLQKLDLEDEIVVDDGGVLLLPAPFLVQIGVDAAIVLLVARAQRIVLGKVVEGGEDVAQAQDHAEQPDERLLLFLAHDDGTGKNRLKRELLSQLVQAVVVLGKVLSIGLEQHHAARLLVAEQADGVAHAVLQVAEAHDVSVGLYGVEDAVGTAEGLDEAMVFEVLVHPERVQGGSVEAGEEHVDHDSQIHLALLHAVRQVLVVVLKALRARVETGCEHGVVVADGGLQEVAARGVQAGHVEALIRKAAAIVGLVGAEAVDEGNLQLLAGALGLDALEGRIVHLRHVDGGCGENGVEAHDALALEVVAARALGLLSVVVKDVVGNQVHASSCLVGALAVDVVDLLVFVLVALPDGLDVVHPERQHVFVAYGVHDGVGVQLVAEGLLGGSQVCHFAAAGVFRKDRRAGEAEQVVVLEVPGYGHVHVAKLATVALVEDDDAVLRIDVVLIVLLDEAGELLDGGHQDAAVRVGKLPGQYGRGLAAVHSTLFEAVVLAHGLVVQVLAVHHEHDLVHACHLAGELCGLEAGERLSRSRAVPDVAAGTQGAQHGLVVFADEDAVQYALGGHDLVRAHD